jgi:hypothetical protein
MMNRLDVVPGKLIETPIILMECAAFCAPKQSLSSGNSLSFRALSQWRSSFSDYQVLLQDTQEEKPAACPCSWLLDGARLWTQVEENSPATRGLEYLALQIAFDKALSSIACRLDAVIVLVYPHRFAIDCAYIEEDHDRLEL